MLHSEVQTEAAPRSRSPLSQGIKYGDLLFVSGQVPLNPATGTMVEGGITEQTWQCLTNLDAILRAAGTTKEHVLKTTCFLVDLGEVADFNSAYADFFRADLPARSTFEVSRLANDFRVEIEAVAYIPSRS